MEEVNSNLGAATVRTALPAVWAAVILWVATKLGLNFNADDLIVLAPVIGFVTAFVYRLAREIEVRFPLFGRLFLGSSKQPWYDTDPEV